MVMVYLDYNDVKRAGAIVDRDKHLAKYNIVKYDKHGDMTQVIQPYKLSVGAPLVVCIEGTYVLMSALDDIMTYRQRKHYEKYGTRVLAWKRV